MSTNRDRLVVLDAEPDCFAFCAFRNITVSVWWWQATGPAVTRMNAVARTVAREYPQGMSNIHIVKEGALMPDAEGRKGLMKLMHDYQSDIACACVVVGGTGFWASALRAAVTGVWLAATQPIELRLMGTYEEVATWVLPKHRARTNVNIESDDLLDLLQQVDSRDLTQQKTRRSA